MDLLKIKEELAVIECLAETGYEVFASRPNGESLTEDEKKVFRILNAIRMCARKFCDDLDSPV